MALRRARSGMLCGSAAALLLSVLWSAAAVQTPGDSFYFSGRPYGPLDYYLDGPPDTLGCPRQCPRDLSPCDPPLFKKADGRCKNNDGR